MPIADVDCLFGKKVTRLRIRVLVWIFRAIAATQTGYGSASEVGPRVSRLRFEHSDITGTAEIWAPGSREVMGLRVRALSPAEEDELVQEPGSGSCEVGMCSWCMIEGAESRDVSASVKRNHSPDCL